MRDSGADSGAGDKAKTLLQALAIAIIAGMLSMIAHKGYVDISALAQRYSGDEFWKAFGRYLLGNLGA
jgi:hypothetical protein